MHRIVIIPFLFLFALIQPSCNPDSAVTDQKDAELALLMRKMFDETLEVKKSIVQGDTTVELPRFEDIHTAIPTDPDVHEEGFYAFADAYLWAVDALDVADTAHAEHFNAVVDQCMHCHTEYCPGPKVRIKKLYIPEGR